MSSDIWGAATCALGVLVTAHSAAVFWGGQATSEGGGLDGDQQ